jgi:predicted house-cleaning NTP pyrophosphatase (Maf/HAM1 superfamily)
VSGSYTNVIGLPLETLQEAFDELGYQAYSQPRQ